MSELKHYGVPGMKWGVRRDIALRAKEVSVLRNVSKTNSKYISRADRKIEKKSSLGKDTTKLQTKRDNKNLANEKIAKLMKTAYSDISEKDIKQGKRALAINRAFGVPGLSAIDYGATYKMAMDRYKG